MNVLTPLEIRQVQEEAVAILIMGPVKELLDLWSVTGMPEVPCKGLIFFFFFFSIPCPPDVDFLLEGLEYFWMNEICWSEVILIHVQTQMDRQERNVIQYMSDRTGQKGRGQIGEILCGHSSSPEISFFTDFQIMRYSDGKFFSSRVHPMKQCMHV